MDNRYSELLHKIEFSDDFNQTTARKMLDAISKTERSGRILSRTKTKSIKALWIKIGATSAIACLVVLSLYLLQPQLFKSNLPGFTTLVSSSNEREKVIIHSFDIGQNTLTRTTLHNAIYSMYVDMPRVDGVTLYSDALRAAIQEYQGSDTFCTVWIFLNVDVENAIKPYAHSTFKYKGLTISEWKIRYLNALPSLDAWKRNEWISLYGKETESNNYDIWLGMDKNSLTIEENWNNEYGQIWQANNPGQDYPVSNYMEAVSRRDNGERQAVAALYEQCIRDLAGYGLTLSPAQNQDYIYAATLSIQQLQEIPEVEGINGYTVLFADEKNCSFEGKYLTSSLNIPDNSLEYIILHMTDTDRFETEVSLFGYSQAQFDEVFKQAYPDAYLIMHEEDLRDKSSPCPNPSEVGEANKTRLDFAQNVFFPRKINEFLEKYEIPDENIILLSYGNTTEMPSCVILANRDLLIKLLVDSEIKEIHITGELR